MADRFDRLTEWLVELAIRLLLGREPGDGVNFGFLIAATVLLVAIGLVVWRVGLPRWKRRRRDAAVDLDPSRPAADYRRQADEHAQRGDWASAVRFRGVVRELEAAPREIGSVIIHPQIMAYIVDVVRATRLSPSLQIGVSPRGATAIMRTARAWAWMSGRDYVSPDDVKALAFPTLRHRVSLRPEAELEGVTTDSVIESILATVPVPR